MKTITITILMFTSMSTWSSCTNYIDNDWPNHRYIDHGNGTVTDRTTNLMWKQCIEGQSGIACDEGVDTAPNWEEALLIPENLNNTGGYAGYTDWRLPNVEELRSLVAYNCFDPAINGELFPNTPSRPFWSSTPTTGRYNSWMMNFRDGHNSWDDRPTSNVRVRLVRSN